MADCDIPLNLARPNDAILLINKFPTMEWNIQKFSIPSFYIDSIQTYYPTTVVHQAGHKIVYDPLVVNMKLTEGLSNLTPIAEWLQTSLHKNKEDKFSDATIHILKGSNKTVMKKVKFINLLPVFIGDINFSFDNINPDSFIDCSIRFVYDRYEYLND